MTSFVKERLFDHGGSLDRLFRKDAQGRKKISKPAALTKGERGKRIHVRSSKLGRRLVRDALLGFAFGYFILHPVSMIIFGCLDFSQSSMKHSGHDSIFVDPIVHSFQFDMLPMGLVFGIFSSLIALANGYNRWTISSQRDSLSNQLQINEALRRKSEEHALLLAEQNEQLDKLEKTRQRMTRYMVHDFKTHLGTIIGFSDIILDKAELDPVGDAKTAVERIRRQGHRMMEEVNDLLDYSRLQAIEGIKTEKVDVLELMRGAASDFSLPQYEGLVELGEGHRHCRGIKGDRRLLRRVLINLIANAFIHNPHGTRVHLNSFQSDNDSEAVFVCRDNGRGMGIDVLPHIFDEFSSGRPDSEGAGGLGLAFCKAIVEGHGGHIWCESTEGAGTCFFFTVPLVKEIKK